MTGSIASEIRSGVSGAVQGVADLLFGKATPDKPKEYINMRAHKDAQVVTEFISFDGRRYSYDFTGPSDAEVQQRVDKSAQGSTVPRGIIAAQVREKLTKEKSNKIRRTLADAFTKYQEYLEITCKAEPGISQRTTTAKTFEEFVGSLGDIQVNDMGVHDYHPFMVNANTDEYVPYDDKLVKGEISKLIDELNVEIIKRRETRRERKLASSGAKGGRVIDGSIYKDRKNTDDRFVDGTSHVKYEVGMPKIEDTDSVGDAFHRLAMDFGGMGNKDHQILEHLRYHSRFGKSMVASPRELTGFTFITRPHLNLSNQNLIQMRNFYPLLYASNNSVQMYIRQMLDTTYAYTNGGKGGPLECPFMDIQNPFNVLLDNSLKSINGFPDPDLTTESTAGGFFSEQQTNVIGYNRLAKGQDLQLEFKDILGGPVLAMHDYWCQYMGNIADGSMCQYTDDIEANLMGYTVSIYRFITDHTGRIITRWAKATGCYPKMQPTGTPFNVNANEKVIESVKSFTVPYWCHHFGYNDPAIITEFNTLVARYNPAFDPKMSMWIGKDKSRTILYTFNANELGPSVRNGHYGTPFIMQPEPGVFELAWIVDNKYTNLLDTDQSKNKRVSENATDTVKPTYMYPLGENGKPMAKPFRPGYRANWHQKEEPAEA